MSAWDDDTDHVGDDATDVGSSGDSDFGSDGSVDDSAFSDLPSDDEVFSDFGSGDTGVDSDGVDPDESGMGITAWNPDADDEYLGEGPAPASDHVADDGRVDEFGEYDPSRGDDIPPPPPEEEESSALGWPVWLGLALATILLVGGASAAAFYYTRSDDKPLDDAQTSETVAEWPSSLVTPPGGTSPGEPGEEDLEAVVASLEADRNRLASENEQLRAEGGGEPSTTTVTSTSTSTRAAPAPPARTITERAPAPPARTVTADPPPPRVVTNTVTAAAPPPRVVTNTVTRTETISGGRVTVTRTIIQR